MGSAATTQRDKTVYVEHDGKQLPIVFSPHCSTQELRDLLTSAAGISRWSAISLTTQQGAHIAVSPSMQVNTPRTAYKLLHNASCDGDTQVLNTVLQKVSEEFSKAFHIQEFTSEFSSRLHALERRIEVESLKTVEIDQCKKDMARLREQVTSHTILQKEHDRSTSRVRKHVPLYPKYVLSEETVEYLKKPTFDIWHWENNEMLCLLEHMYNELDLVNTLHISPITLRRWLLEVQENYRDNPFHNFRHCFCVAQMMYGMIHLLNLQSTFSKLEVATLLTAAICHDIDHPGFNNNYQINAKTELAIRYNDKSPLENHHCAVTFQILEKPETNLFSFVSKEDFKRIRSGIIDLILATDMAHHSEIMEAFKSVMREFDNNNEHHRRLLRQMLMKACDTSNEVRPKEVAEPWVDCLLEEYFMQSDREKREGLPVAPFMDRDKVTKPTAQIGFIQFVLIPMFEALNTLFPQLEGPILQPLRRSLDHYERLKMLEDVRKEEGPVKSHERRGSQWKSGAKNKT